MVERARKKENFVTSSIVESKKNTLFILKITNGRTLLGGGNGAIQSSDKYKDLDLTVKVKVKPANQDEGSGKTAISFVDGDNRFYSVRKGF